MIALLGAVLAASLLGSLHCVGMCGPLAILAVGTGSGTGKTLLARSQGWQLRLAAYHSGRLLTYGCMGIVVGSVGLVVDSGGTAFGTAGLAARIAGGVLIAVGVWRLLVLWFPRSATMLPPWGHFIARWLASFHQWIAKLSPTARATAIGSLTTLLPCGWLYVFALVASGTGHPLPAVLVMAAFWIGTLPALTAVVAGFTQVGGRMGRALPLMVCSLLIGTDGTRQPVVRRPILPR